jgi:hypothetical protein
VVVPPASVASTGEEINVESKPVETDVEWISQVQKVACDRISPTYATTISFPTCQIENTVAKGAKMLIWWGECDPQRGHNDDEAMRRPLGVACCTLLPQLLLFGDLLRDFLIAPFRDGHLPKKAEVNTSLLGCSSAKLTRLTMLAPERQALGHFFFGCGRVVEQTFACNISLLKGCLTRHTSPPKREKSSATALILQSPRLSWS